MQSNLSNFSFMDYAVGGVFKTHHQIQGHLDSPPPCYFLEVLHYIFYVCDQIWVKFCEKFNVSV